MSSRYVHPTPYGLSFQTESQKVKRLLGAHHGLALFRRPYPHRHPGSADDVAILGLPPAAEVGFHPASEPCRLASGVVLIQIIQMHRHLQGVRAQALDLAHNLLPVHARLQQEDGGHEAGATRPAATVDGDGTLLLQQR